MDTLPPPAPVVSTPANGAITNTSQPAVTGTATTNLTVTVYLDGVSSGTTTADGSGSWSFTPAAPPSDGAHTAKATATDSANNTSVDSNSITFIIDTTAPNTSITSTRRRSPTASRRHWSLRPPMSSAATLRQA